MKKQVINRTKNAREFSAHLDNKLRRRLRKIIRAQEREAKEMRLLLSVEGGRLC